MTQKEPSEQLQNLKSRRDHLAQLIAAAGPRAPKCWVKEVGEIDARISRVTSAERENGKLTDVLDTDTAEQIYKHIGDVYKHIKVWVLLRAGRILMALLLITLGLLCLKYYLESVTDRTELRHRNGATITVEYPRFIFSNKYFGILFCAHGQQVPAVGVEIKPQSLDFRIKGGKWHHKFDLSEAARDDWQPSLACEPNSPWSTIPYQQRSIVAIGKDHTGSPFTTKPLALNVIGFYHVLSLAALVVLGVAGAIRERLLAVILQMFQSGISRS